MVLAESPAWEQVAKTSRNRRKQSGMVSRSHATGNGKIPVNRVTGNQGSPRTSGVVKARDSIAECHVSHEESLSQKQREGNEGTSLGQAVRPRNL